MTARTLFTKSSLHKHLRLRQQAALDEARRLDDQTLLYGDLTAEAKRLAENHRLVTPVLEKPVIDGPKGVSLSPQELRGLPGFFSSGLPAPREGYRGTQVRVLVPFRGTPDLFEYQPSHFTLSPPHAQLDKAGRQLVFTDRFLESQYNPSTYLPTVAGKIKPFEWWLTQVEAEVGPYNKRLLQGILNILEERRRQLTETLRQAELHGLGSTFDPSRVARLLFEARERAELSLLGRPTLPHPQQAALLPEHDYALVLEALDRFARRLERSNTVVRELGEEALRDVLLAALNMYFPGQATGETFNWTGKTDLLVQYGGQTAFVGECKFWGGEKMFLETVDQLLGYLTSRDLLTAVVVFNRTRDISAVAAKILVAVRAYAQDVEEREIDLAQRRFRFRLSHPQDRTLRLDLAVLLYDL